MNVILQKSPRMTPKASYRNEYHIPNVNTRKVTESSADLSPSTERNRSEIESFATPSQIEVKKSFKGNNSLKLK